MMLCTSISSCSPSRHLSHASHPVTHDSLSVTHIQYDSVYICKEITYEPLDSVTAKLPPFEGGKGWALTKTMTEFRYKLLRDTLTVVRVDSIPYEVQIVEIQKVRYIPPWLKILSGIGILALCVLLRLTTS